MKEQQIGLYHENQCLEAGFRLIAGTDEVGRGPLAGPVVAAACILLPGFSIEGINDSKKLTKQQRETLFREITASKEIIYSVSVIENQIIDQVNILQASLLAMKNSLESLSQLPDFVLVDGHIYPNVQIPGKCIVKGDAISLSIATASILAKYTRDQIMIEAHKKYPEYSFDTNVGYATEAHLKALKKYGPCPIHRRSFEPVSLASSPSLFELI